MKPAPGATYTPSAADIAAGSIILTLTANGNGPCAAEQSTKTVTITPKHQLPLRVLIFIPVPA